MAATLIGKTGTFGITSDQTGLIITAQDENFSTQTRPVLNNTGEPVGMALYGDRLAMTIRGLATSSSPFDSRMAATLTAANTYSDHFRAAVTTSFGRNVIESVRRSLAIEDFVQFEVGSTLYPLMSTQ